MKETGRMEEGGETRCFKKQDEECGELAGC